MLAPHRKKGKAPPRTSLETNRTSTEEAEKEEQPVVVLPSSTELFYFYGQSLDQCAKLSTGQAFFDLCNLHRKWLRIYAGGFLAALDVFAEFYMECIIEDVLSFNAPKQR